MANWDNGRNWSTQWVIDDPKIFVIPPQGQTVANLYRVKAKPQAKRAGYAAAAATETAGTPAISSRAIGRRRLRAARRNVRMRRWPQSAGNSGSTSAGRSPTVWRSVPDGALRRHKLLSSGVTKGRVADGSSRDAIVDPQRARRSAELLDWLAACDRR